MSELPQPRHPENPAIEARPGAPAKTTYGCLWLLIVLIIAAGAIWWFGFRNKKSTATTQPAGRHGGGGGPVPVVAVPAHRGDMPVYLTGLGTAQALNTVIVHTRIDGQLMQVAYKEGQFVHQGDLLVQIDPRPYQAVLDQAKAQLAKDQSLLANAQLDLQRDKLAGEAIPAQQLDTQRATVDQDQAALKIDQAQIETAQLNITYCHITAPIAGWVGLRLVDVGNMVHATDSNGIVVITQTQPITVVITLPERDIPQLMDRMRTPPLPEVDAFQDQTKLASGHVLAVDNQVNTSSGTFQVKAIFDNKDNALFPNQYLDARVLVQIQKNVVIVPAAAVQHGPDSAFIYVVKPDNTVEIRNIGEGIEQGSNAVVASGIEPDEMCVTDGVDKLQAGTKVVVRSPAATQATTREAAEESTTGPSTRPAGSGHRHKKRNAE
ncbi:MAG TPA: efflux RND transporter periplasmic adaptor subunit [Tepidisphaeraceae bacterium]|jgi:multidrug efflux system membrane fusion protein